MATGTDQRADLSDDEINAVADPLERGRILRQIAEDRGTLTASQSAIWTKTVAELGGPDLDERHPKWIARQFKVSPSRIRQILGRARKAQADLQLAVGVTGPYPRCAHREDLLTSEGV